MRAHCEFYLAWFDSAGIAFGKLINTSFLHLKLTIGRAKYELGVRDAPTEGVARLAASHTIPEPQLKPAFGRNGRTRQTTHPIEQVGMRLPPIWAGNTFPF